MLLQLGWIHSGIGPPAIHRGSPSARNHLRSTCDVAAVGARTPVGINRIAALCTMMTRNNWRRFVGSWTVSPINSSEKARLTGGGDRGSGTVPVSDVIMALISLEKPTSPERIPVDGNHPPALRLNLVSDPSCIEEVHSDADRQSSGDRQQDCRAHTAILSELEKRRNWKITGCRCG